MVAVNSPDGLQMHTGDRSVTVAKHRDHQEGLRAFVDVCGRTTAVACVSLVPTKISCGKHDGQETLEARLDGQRVGELTRRWRSGTCRSCGRHSMRDTSLAARR